MLSDLYFYFNATRAQSNVLDQYILNYKVENYAVDVKLSFNNSGVMTDKNVCKFLIYGQGSSGEERYLLGNAFLRGYYTMLAF